MTAERPILIRNARLLTMVDGQDETAGDVLIADGVIQAVGGRIDHPEAEVIDAVAGILMPGFVDTHRHVWQTQLRSVAADWSLFDYFVRMRMICSAFYSPDDVWLGNHIGALEALHAGVTTMVDHCHILNSPDHADAALKGLIDAGGRGIFCYGLFGNPRGHDPLVAEIAPNWLAADIRRLRVGTGFSGQNRILFGMAPAEAEATPLPHLLGELNLARELGAHSISLHVAMGGYDQGHRVVQQLADAGALGPDLLFVHGAALTAAEQAAIAEAGAGLSVTPETEMQMGMGHPLAFTAQAAGIRTGLGIDIVSNYAGDMFRQMRLMLQAERARRNAALEARGGAPRQITPTAREVLRMATLGGAEALHLEDRIGSIAPGKRADLILVRTDTVNMCPTIDAVAAIVLNAAPSDVDMVMVDGRIIKCCGTLAGVDWPGLATRLEASAMRITAAAARVDRAPIEAMGAGLFANLT
ncbi:MAG: cytosine deaminase [Tistrella sp.]|nr:amidohydrolase family protein [Tistrella sp.]MAD39454.1 cytosine deaminase [Tistrella sp.]MBA74799.1 cytosine deaminase [Tistrella sp.]